MNTRKDGGVKLAAVVMGVSAGGVKALSAILPHFSAGFVLPVIIVQHLHPSSGDFIVDYLQEKSALNVKRADEKENITPGTIYIAPPNYHLMIEEDRTFSLSVERHVNYARPSIDILFETAADVYGTGLIGVILTGASRDGSRGLRRISEKGGLTIIQDPASSEVDIMPRAALKASKIDYVLPLDEIGPFLDKLGHSNGHKMKHKESKVMIF